jgi:WD40 repeat protein
LSCKQAILQWQGFQPTLPSHLNWFCYSGDYDYKIKLWNLETYELITILSQHTGQVLSLDICPDDEILVSGSIDGYINVWDFKTYNLLYTVKNFNLQNNLNSTSSHEYHINPLVIHPDGTRIFNGIFKNMVKIWDIEEGEKIGEFHPPNEAYLQSRYIYINSIVISPNGQFLLTNNHEEIQIWNIESRQLIRTLKGHIGTVYCLKFSPDGTIIASCGEDCTIKLWNFETGQLLKILSKHNNKVHKDKVYSLAFSPDGRTLVSGGRDRTLKIWQIPDFTLPKTEIS